MNASELMGTKLNEFVKELYKFDLSGRKFVSNYMPPEICDNAKMLCKYLDCCFSRAFAGDII